MKGLLNTIILTQLIALVLLALLLYPQEGMHRELIWGIMSFFFMLYLPGYWVSYMFFTEEDEISAFERFVMSFAISLALITFTAFYLHYFGIALYPIHIYSISLIIIVFACIYVWVMRKLHHSMEEE